MIRTDIEYNLYFEIRKPLENYTTTECVHRSDLSAGSGIFLIEPDQVFSYFNSLIIKLHILTLCISLMNACINLWNGCTRSWLSCGSLLYSCGRLWYDCTRVWLMHNHMWLEHNHVWLGNNHVWLGNNRLWLGNNRLWLKHNSNLLLLKKAMNLYKSLLSEIRKTLHIYLFSLIRGETPLSGVHFICKDITDTDTDTDTAVSTGNTLSTRLTSC